MRHSHVDHNVREKVKEKLTCTQYYNDRGCIVSFRKKKKIIREEVKNKENVIKLRKAKIIESKSYARQISKNLRGTIKKQGLAK